ncbi:hypothetical protein [Bifidobacterium dolichotidis]|uniref:hypothetical protein n=1 Tax=Bifidobacterium dolichotidis TaxID=2306976 RepID=UPI000F7DEC8E|nr:hypothetical protein [Bifidobacterium dolichotidis]
MTAMKLYGADAPESLKLSNEKIHVTVPLEKQKFSHMGDVVYHSWSHEMWAVDYEGLNVMAPEPLVAQMARFMHVGELVELASVLCCRDKKFRVTSVEQIRQYALRTHKFHGRRTLLEALKCMPDNTDSPQEAAVMFWLVSEGNLPKPEVNHKVTDTQGTMYIDLAYVKERLAIEYQGEHHFRGKYPRLDVERYKRLQALGWEVVYVTADDLRSSKAISQLIARIQILLQQRSSIAYLLGQEVAC